MDTVKHLLPPVPRYFKANLHTHSNISDGKLTPAEVKAAYKGQGYSILAITDHNVIVDHSDMTEPDFLMLTGMEININEDSYRPSKGFCGKTCHLNLISKTPDNLWQPGRVSGIRETARPYEEKVQCEIMPRVHEADALNAMIARAGEKGFLVMYNHPTWSGHSYPDYAGLKGLWAMELRNANCCNIGHNENNHRVYQDLLELGTRLFPTGTDDMHKPEDLFGAWIMVGAGKLEYASVIKALECGDFYTSCGPQIKALTLEGNTLRITCSDAARISLETQARFTRQAAAGEDTVLTQGEFDLSVWREKSQGDPNAFFRLTVTAPDGSYAATRAYWLDEL